MFHAYGVPRLWCCIKTQGKKGERLIAEKKEPEDWDLGPLQERLRMPHSAPGGGWRSLAELLTSLRMRTSANRLSRKFVVNSYEGFPFSPSSPRSLFLSQSWWLWPLGMMEIIMSSNSCREDAFSNCSSFHPLALMRLTPPMATPLRSTSLRLANLRSAPHRTTP